MEQSPQSPDLPDEILISIISHLDLISLATAALVSKHFNDIVEPYLYAHQEILRGCHADALSQALRSENLRAGWVKSLLVSVKFGDDRGLDHLPVFVRGMENLRTLTLETPDCNRRPPDDRISWISLQDRYERIFEDASVLAPESQGRCLPRLEQCTLHFVDNRTELYSLTKYPSIFLHPNLKSLTISCTSTDFLDSYPEHVQSDDSLKRTTALEYLHLEECDIEAGTLAMILRFPRALKSLKISEGIRYDSGFRTGSSRLHGNVKPQHLMEALTWACANDLESLSLALGYRRHSRDSILQPGKYLRMVAMERLTHLEVDLKTLDLLRSHPVCDHTTYRRLPPNLRTFKVFGILLGHHNIFEQQRTPKIPLQGCLIREKAQHGVPNLETVIYEFDHYDDSDDLEFDLPDMLAGDNNPAPPQPGHGVHLPPALFADAGVAALLNDPNLITLMNNPDFLAGLGNQPGALRNIVRTALLRSDLAPSTSAREYTRTQVSLMKLLDLLNSEALQPHKQSGTLLRVDLKMLPHGFIPPYLSNEEKPIITQGWWTSDDPMDIGNYKAEIALSLKAKSLERGLAAERERRMHPNETDQEEEDSEAEESEEQDDMDESDRSADGDYVSMQPGRSPQESDLDADDTDDDNDSDGSLYVDAEMT